MRIDIQARGFPLTTPLRHAVEFEAHEYSTQFPKAITSIRARLFDTNGPRGGLDKGCLLHARMRQGSTSVVATDIDADLYRAIAAAFAKLARGTRSALGARAAFRRTPGWQRSSRPIAET